ncbi:hypothetical protein Pve01_82660 [Planomonospora venezuelensis]|nr:hypothetical protein Pve01_82660 [Planomonospora venezuelensis]
MRRRVANSGPVVVVSFTGNSGLTDYSASFCREVAKTDEVVLLTAESIDPFFRGMGFPVEAIFRRSRHYPVDVLRFLRRIVALQPRVVLFQGPLKFPLVDALAVRYLRRRGVPVAAVVHDVVPHNERAISTAALHAYYRAFPCLIAHSEDAADRLRVAGIRASTMVVPHGRYDIFDIDSLSRADARSSLGIDGDAVVALFFGNLEERKGLGEFVAAAEKDAGATALFLAAGKDFLSASAPRSLKETIRNERVVEGLRVDSGRVPHRQVQFYFRAADVVVLPYREGSTSGVLKLAFAFGVPVLATDVGDIREQLTEGLGQVINGEATPDAIVAGVAELAGRARLQNVDVSLEWSDIAPRVMSFLRRPDSGSVEVVQSTKAHPLPPRDEG